MIKIEDIVLDGKESDSSGRQMPAMTEEEKDILQHHGVIGMRWGKGRKTKVPKQTLAPKVKGVNEAAREKQFKSEYANRDKMSTRSLQNRVKRLQAEQQFKELVNKPAAERAKAAEAIAEKKRKRNKMLLRTALGIYGNVPMESFGKKGKDLKEILGPSQAIAKAASSSDALKNSEVLDNILLHKGVKGMKWGLKNATSQDGAGNDDAAVNQQVDTLNQQIAVEKDPKKKAFLQTTLSKYKNPNAENTRTPQETRDALVKGVDAIKKNIAKETDPSKLAALKKSLKVYNSNIAKVNNQMGVDKTLTHGFKYKSKHQNKNGKWTYIYDDVVKGAKGLLDSNATQKETATGTANVKTYDDGTTFADSYDKNSGWAKTWSKAYNKNSKSDANYDRSHRQLVGISTKLTDPNKSNKNFHKGTVSNTATSIVRKKGTIHKTYDSILKKLGF